MASLYLGAFCLYSSPVIVEDGVTIVFPPTSPVAVQLVSLTAAPERRTKPVAFPSAGPVTASEREIERDAPNLSSPRKPKSPNKIVNMKFPRNFESVDKTDPETRMFY